MKSHSPSSHGHPFTAAAVVGSFALAVVVLLRVAGVFDATDASIRGSSKVVDIKMVSKRRSRLATTVVASRLGM